MATCNFIIKTLHLERVLISCTSSSGRPYIIQ